MLLEEEMRRTIVFNQWNSDAWIARASPIVNADPATLNGLSAYAHKQARIFGDLATLFDIKWRAIRLRAAAVISSTSPLDATDVVPEIVDWDGDEALETNTEQAWEVDAWDLRGMEED